MKKLLIVLMVVAMASFLFTGCIPTTPEEEVPVVPVVPVVPATVAPIITGVPDAADLYVNAAEALNGIVVDGTAPTYSEVKVYINGICAGTGDTAVNGVFSVVVANADLIKAGLKVDGAKTLYATATEAGLAESAHSNEIKFTLDTVAPKVKEVKARGGVAGAGQTVVVTPAAAGSAIYPGIVVTPAAITVPAVYQIDVLTATTARITGTDILTATYTVAAGALFVANAPIPGIGFQFKNIVTVTTLAAGDTFNANVGADTIVCAGGFGTLQAGDFVTVANTISNNGTYTVATVAATVLTLIATDTLINEVEAAPLATITSSAFAIGQQSIITITAATPGTLGRVSLAFDEDISTTAALAGTYTIINWLGFGWNILNPLAPDWGITSLLTFNESTDTIFWQEAAGSGSWDLWQYDQLFFTVSGVTDLAGNPMSLWNGTTFVLAPTVAIGP